MSRSRRSWTAITRAALTLGLATVLVPACGGESFAGSDPKTWAGQVCTEIGSWTEKARVRAATIQAELAQARTARQLRDRYVAEYGEGVRVTDELLAGLDRAGKPAVEDGERIQRELRGLFERLRASIVRAQERVRAASVSNLSSFQAELTAINQEYSTAVQRVAADVGQLGDERDSGTVRKALDDEPACDRLGSG